MPYPTALQAVELKRVPKSLHRTLVVTVRFRFVGRQPSGTTLRRSSGQPRGIESADRRRYRENARTSAPARHGRSAFRAARIYSGSRTAIGPANARVMRSA